MKRIHLEGEEVSRKNSNLRKKTISPSVYHSIDRLIHNHRKWLGGFRKIKKPRIPSESGIKEEKPEPGITVITSTIRQEYMQEVFENYNRQTYKTKEFIIILNKNSMELKRWQEKAKNYPNVRVYQLDESISFGECYNFCVTKAKYDYIAPFDDDDYYAPKYLRDIVEAFQVSGADVVGKRTRYIYFESTKILAIANPYNENCFVEHIDGPTLSFNKRIFDRIQFSKNPGIDTQFCKDCVAQNIKIYSTNRFNHVYIRHSQAHNHTWRINDSTLMSWCQVVAKTKDYKKYVTK